MKVISNNFSETKELGEKIASELFNCPNKEKTALIIGLKGDLGAGKTTFVQGFALGLGIKKRILSPTFIIFNKYKLKSNNFDNFYHFDCYRIENYEEMNSIEFEKIILNPKNMVIIEWPEKIKKIVPKNVKILKFRILKKGKREINI
jgi:tRNA threonylcarbamoyl adenosine modification protein YjeE